MAVSGVFAGVLEESPGKIPGKLLERIFPNRQMLQILGFRAPGKANLPGTLGPHCRDLVPTFRAGCFSKSTVPAFSSFLDWGPSKPLAAPQPLKVALPLRKRRSLEVPGRGEFQEGRGRWGGGKKEGKGMRKKWIKEPAVLKEKVNYYTVNLASRRETPVKPRKM